MALIHIPAAAPFITENAQTRVKRPFRGVTLGAMADAINGLAGYRFLNVVTAHIECAVTGYEDDGPVAGPTHARIRWRTGPVATHAWVCVHYVAYDFVSGVAPHIDAVLETYTGVVLDPGVRWQYEDSLPTAEWGPVIDLSTADRMTALASASAANEQRVHTGVTVVPGAGGAQTVPRPLVLPDPPGVDVQVHLIWEWGRVYSCSVWEIYGEAIEQ